MIPHISWHIHLKTKSVVTKPSTGHMEASKEEWVNLENYFGTWMIA